MIVHPFNFSLKNFIVFWFYWKELSLVVNGRDHILKCFLGAGE
jgi:hypothetical protein